MYLQVECLMFGRWLFSRKHPGSFPPPQCQTLPCVAVVLWKYCKTLNVSVRFISRISRAKQNHENKGCEYQLPKNRTKLL